LYDIVDFPAKFQLLTTHQILVCCDLSVAVFIFSWPY